MIPSVVVAQLQDTLVDYVMATLAFDDPSFATAFEAHLRGPDGLFRGPYLRTGLPFKVAGPAEPIPLTIRPDFLPYAHQLQAFRQLASGSAEPSRNTLVTTGTGSGKTECFLYPILDHCFRRQGTPGVKAIIIYPMNALATDQARRLAALIDGDDLLRGKVRAGLYVGGGDKGLPAHMGADHVVENKTVLRAEPPDILLTNYKMLDYMLVRPDERRLWLHNQPDTLRYLVIDELHTFDGAQGSDVACLVRRLKTRLQTPTGHLICAGTSATIGSSSDDDAAGKLAAFATEVFDEPFEASHVVREHRERRADFLRPMGHGPALPVAADGELEFAGDGDPLAWLDSQQRAWLGEVRDRIGLGDALRAHPVLNHLLAVSASRPVSFAEVDAGLAARMDAWGALPPGRRARLLTSFLALVSHAQRDVGGVARPLVTVQVQLWARELTRLLRALPDQEAGALRPVQFAWWSDVPGSASSAGLYAPQAHCRECGIDGIAAVQSEVDKAKGRVSLAPALVGTAWMQGSRDAVFLWPRPLDPGETPSLAEHWLDPTSATLSGAPPIDGDGQPRGAPVLIENTLHDAGERKRFSARCPACGQDDALSIVGARAASLLSVVVTQLYQTPHNTDRKLLAFTDSVQDACHRAGFFGGRTYRIHLRTAMQAAIASRDALPLDQAAAAFEAHWRGTLGDLAYVAGFLPPDLRELPEFEAWVEQQGKGRHDRLWNILRRRLAWEFTREFGVAAAIGRSLERSAASTVRVEPSRFAVAAAAFGAWVGEQAEADAGAAPAQFLRGLLHRMRHMGAIHHRFLDEYARRDGNRFLLSKGKNPHMSPVGPFTKRIRFVTSRPRGEVFASPFGRRAGTGWFGDWARRALRWAEPGPDALGRIYRRALDALTEAGVLKKVAGAGGVEVWGIDPASLVLTTDVGAVQAGHRGRVYHVATSTAEAADGEVSWGFRHIAPLRRVAPAVGYYADVYGRGTTTRVFPGEHTGLLSRERRTELESRFLAGATAEDPQAPNLLVATPTLEMGVDIGDLSAAMLCSVPPTPSSYLQRIGRAGRKTGNAVVFVLANAQPHDLYFYADPTQMIDGSIDPPGVFLGAVAMLQRQLSAWCMDHWARDDDDAGPIPRKTSLVLGPTGRLQFPGRFLEHVARHRRDLVAGFRDRFGARLTDEGRAALAAWVEAPELGLDAAFQAAFDAVRDHVDGYRAERDRALRRIKKIEEDPTAVANAELEVRELTRYRITLGHLIDELRNKYTLNVLADASLLPNYAFPETGVTLHSRLGSDGEAADGTPKRVYEKREYVRPAARALRELAPFNTFYAEGHRVRIRELDLGPKASRVQRWRLCPSCHHRQAAVDPTAPPTEGACPRCGDPHWVDVGQVRLMLPLNTVRSVADRVRSTTADDTDERTIESFQIQQLFDVRAENLDGEAVILPELGFGFEYAREVTLTEINLGLSVTLEGAPKVRVAGELASAQGFPTCRDCGTVRDPRDTGGRSRLPDHSPFCPQKDGDTKPRDELYLFREVRSEAVRFLLPFSEVAVEPKLRSFQAAVALGLRRVFGGRPLHLQIATMSEPSGANRDARKHFLVLFDAVPGGTGYLREYRHRHAVFALLERALEALRGCRCRQLGRDGCYVCLFAHQSQRHLPLLSSRLAEDLLDRVVRARHTAEVVAGGLSGAAVAAVLESELEERFVGAMQVRYGDAFRAIDGGKRWELSVNGSTWQLDPQVWLTEQAGEPMRADFVFTGVAGPALHERVVVECDGAGVHVQPEAPQGRVTSDLRKRGRVASQLGWRVFQLTWHDLSSGGAHNPAPAVLVGVPDAVWRTVADRAVRGAPAAVAPLLRNLRDLPPFALLCSYLDHPGPHWSAGVAALVCGQVAEAARSGALIDRYSVLGVEACLRSAPVPSPLPPVGHVAKPRAGDLWCVAGVEGDVAVLLRAHAPAVLKVSPEGLTALLRLDDRHERRADPAFVASWRGALHALNLLWLLPEVEVVTSEGLEQDEAGLDVLAELGLGLAADADGPAYGGAELDAVLESCFDDGSRALVRAVAAARLPLPLVDRPELCDGLILPDLAWTSPKLAVVNPDHAEPADIDLARRQGWTLLVGPVAVADLIAALRKTPRAP